jgi:hypothetical protein
VSARKYAAMGKKIVLGILFFAFYAVLGSTPLFAASSTLSVSPATGSYGVSFAVDLIIDGKGDVFNAAEASVSASPSLAVQNVVTGDCKFSFMKSPSVADLSFKGVALGKSLKKCTVYTITVAPVLREKGSITVSDAQVLRFGDAKNVLASIQNGSYTLTDIAKISASPTIIPSKENGYSVVLTVLTNNNEPLQSTTVTLRSVSTNNTLTGKTDTAGVVQFSNIEPGVYAASAETYEGENILQIGGGNHAMVLGIKVGPKNTSVVSGFFKELPIIPLLLGVIVVLFLIIIVLFLKSRGRR